MKAILCVLLIMAVCGAASGSDSAIAQILSTFDWQGTRLRVVDPKADPLLYVTIEFEKEGTWKKQKDVWAVAAQMQPAESNPIEPYWGYGRGWGGTDGNSGRGVARPGNFRKEGFDVVFSLKWSLKSKGEGEFKETIPCKWVPEQSFEKDGFRITVILRPAATK